MPPRQGIAELTALGFTRAEAEAFFHDLVDAERAMGVAPPDTSGAAAERNDAGDTGDAAERNDAGDTGDAGDDP